jgi:hydrogenase-1 operon protein HyaF
MTHLTNSDALPVEPGEGLTHNVQPLLHEIRHALAQLLETGSASTIDLRSIPLAPGEEERLLAALGEGEIHARLSALGPSEIIETRFPGVWLVTHCNAQDETIGRFIEICDMPRILMAQTEDIRDGLEQLEARLGAAGDRPA